MRAGHLRLVSIRKQKEGRLALAAIAVTPLDGCGLSPRREVMRVFRDDDIVEGNGLFIPLRVTANIGLVT